MKTQTIAICAALVVLLAACVSKADESAGTVPTDVPTAGLQAEDAAMESVPSASDDVIIQYDVFGGLMAPGAGTRIPLWTLYNDGLMVWVEDGSPTPGFAAQVWTGHLSEDEVTSLLAFADEVGFWELSTAYGPEPVMEVATAEPGGIGSLKPNPEAGLDQPTSVLFVAAGDKQHQVTVYPADWHGAPEGYHALRQLLLETRSADAAPFTPASFALSAQVVADGAAGGLRVSAWPFADISLADVVAAPLSLDSEQGIALADFVAADGQYVSQDGVVYKVDLLAAAPRAP